MDAGELSRRTWSEYKAAGDLLVNEFGKSRAVADLHADDFSRLRNRMAKKWGRHRLANTIQYIRSVFKHAYESGQIDRPIRFGPGLCRPTKKTLRLHRAKQDRKLFTAEEIRRILDAGSVPIWAMILHVVGDYKNPPRAGKYEAKRRRSVESLTQAPVVLGPAWRPIIGGAVRDRLQDLGAFVLCLAQGGQDLHVLAKLPVEAALGLWMGLAKKHSAFEAKRHS